MSGTLPPLNLNSNATSRAGDIWTEGGNTRGSINFNYGSGGITSASTPWWAWLAVGAAAMLWLKRKG